ncbi:calponin homology domain-containing protein [Absidia repens]|uniref:Calponin homology domain-containing protein n=1 Tax=Absidia repens TaxID=90262 RepID=A0A1X2ITZ4_9FUNG|nr:calponin homology domain-containing protein [Absidia repens]
MSKRASFLPSVASQQPVEDTARVMDKAWEVIQQKTFTKWVNNKLDIRGVQHIQNLVDDLAPGVTLIQLLEIIGDASIGRYNRNPRMRIQFVENVNLALEFIKQRGVALTNIGAEDIVDKNLKLILGMLWTIILRFTIANISQEGKNAKEGLLLWCQRKTAPYPEVNVQDFSYSWTDGLAFCALIHRHRPDLLDFDALDKTDRHGNTALAFNVAEQHLGIPQLLDVEDVCDISKPDERSVMTYVAEYFHAFSALDKVETAGRRVAKFAEVIASVWQMQHDYERRVLALMDAVLLTQREWQSTQLTNQYSATKQRGLEFNHYKNTQKREWVTEKREIDSLLGNIQTKLKTYNLKPYYPPEGLTLQDLDNIWSELLQNEAFYHRSINSKIREIKESLRKNYAQAANDFQQQLDNISSEQSLLDGDLDIQLKRVQSLQNKAKPLDKILEKVRLLDQDCIDANTEENDYTVYSVEDLTFGLDLLQQAIQKKNAFIQNQIVSRNMTNLTPAQLEEFEQAFRHFDNDNSNTLSATEFNAALASLGIFYDDDVFDQVFSHVTSRQEQASFEQFIRFMVSVTEDKSTPEQIRDSFRTIAGDKPYVTELELKMCLVPDDIVDYLKHDMPRSSHAEHQDALDYDQYISTLFR